jgi:putative oxidoreductase
MRHFGLLIARVVLGSYLAVHGAQKLFGSFGGGGLEATATGFDRLGMRPGKAMALLAGASELGGGLLTATGVADPLGPIVLAGTMAVASSVHRKQGPLATNGGFELPLTNMALSLALMSGGAGALRIGPRLSKPLTWLSFFAGAALAAGTISMVIRNVPPVTPDVVDESDDVAA